ncbi:hypothetical protein THASP1DRAFT_31446 [Thamnocephalis sphaerospora]|uniref:Yeast cell wall synthesis Kre9/Knh1-like N-terminal domain-containing protein n=1 Tax=Thamnocephalis sphaerospora TaxID=78915 RepID=A0A4P9XMX1_9FUNG|nr:hypothetical protein THASP1DRAFT_31446 [Thamnocephalis sphaerospora]|eukprot:RKP06741.1 hypothetical protein THASP1DRAFT_31446 [Thamnocephalis sphaerospora]
MKTYLVASLATAAMLAAPAYANFYPTFPVGDSVWPAGTQQTITWQDDGSAPSLDAIPSFKLELQTGTDAAQKTLAVVGTTIDPKSKSIRFTIPANIGPSGKVYFFRFTPSVGEIKWTTRFTLTGATGTFPDDVQLPPGSSVSNGNGGTRTSGSSSATSTSDSSSSTSTSSSSSTSTSTSDSTSEPTSSPTSNTRPKSTSNNTDDLEESSAATARLTGLSRVAELVAGSIMTIGIGALALAL